MKQCTYCGRQNEDNAELCSGCGTRRFVDKSPPRQIAPRLLRRRPQGTRGLRFLLGGLIGGSLIVLSFSALTNDWSQARHWAGGIAAISIAVAYFYFEHCFKRLVTRVVVEQVTYDDPPKAAAGRTTIGSDQDYAALDLCSTASCTLGRKVVCSMPSMK